MKLVAGVDEVGRGPLAGPVVTAAVILPQDYDLPGLTDSKKLTAKRREVLSEAIKQQALCFAFGQANLAEIDELNILHATMLAMQRAVAGLSIEPTRVLVDGNRSPDFGIASEAIVGGDGLQPCISAASIIAKVARDQLMSEYALQYPQYGWQNNSGYGTKQHLEALQRFGVSPHHRRSFAPVARLLNS
jgi:ribonuclease HII